METREEIIKRQDELSNKVTDAYREYMIEYEKMYSYFKEMDSDPFYRNLFPSKETRTETNNMLCEMALRDPITYNKISAKIKNHLKEQGKEMFDNTKLNEKKYKYFELLIKSLNSYCEDLMNVFPQEYQRKINKLAEKGYFIYFEQTPDLEKFLVDNVDDNINTVVSLFTNNDCRFLWYHCEQIIKSGLLSSNITERNKASDLQEAIICLQNECYSSCARTLLALINNDHNNASNIFRDYFEAKNTTGFQNSVAITKQLQELNADILVERWLKMDDYYKQLNLGRNDVKPGEFNRHHIVHGNYEDMAMPTKEFCVQLFTFYDSFKFLSYYLQQIYDMSKEIEFDMKCGIVASIKRNKNLN